MNMNTDAAFTAEDLEVLDSSSFVPLYIQLADRISDLVHKRGECAIGKALPSESQCVERLGVSRPTVRQAMARLLSQGLISRSRGRGTFVLPQRLDHNLVNAFEEDVDATSKTVQYRLLTWEAAALPEEVAAEFGRYATGDFFLLRRLRTVDRKAVGLEERYMPERIARQLRHSDIESRPMFRVLQRIEKPKASLLKVEVSSMLAGRSLARLLQVKPGVPLLVRKSTLLAKDGESLMHGTMTFIAEHYKFHFNVDLTQPAG
jgi:GntR family transcriptional regulator